MEGIEILKITEITKVPDFIVIGLIISLIIGVIVVFITQNSYFNRHHIIEGFIIITTTAAVIGFMIAAIFTRVNTGEYKYEIRVNKDVSLNEFYDKYEVLKRYEYSDVYVVKERVTE